MNEKPMPWYDSDDVRQETGTSRATRVFLSDDDEDMRLFLYTMVGLECPGIILFCSISVFVVRL